jgi:hypothetical protein
MSIFVFRILKPKKMKFDIFNIQTPWSSGFISNFQKIKYLSVPTMQCNQPTTLDQTIQYMKSLQQQVQSMSSVAGCSMRPATEAAVYPLAPPLYIQPTAGAIAPHPPMLQPALCRCSDAEDDAAAIYP